MRSRRILLAIPTVTSYYTFLKELMDALDRSGWEVHLACSLNPIHGFDCYRDNIIGHSHHIAFPRGANPVTHLRAARELHRLVTRISPDLIHCHFGVTAFTAALARKVKWPSTIATIQGLTFPQRGGIAKWVFLACEKWSHHRMDETWVLTRCDVEAFAKYHVRGKIFRQESSGFGCRLDLFDRARFTEEQLVRLRASLGIDPDDFVFAFVGRQVHFKGFDVLIRAFLAVAEEYSRAKLLLVGEQDPLHATGLSLSEERLAKASPAIIRVGWVSEVAAYLGIADTNVFPSRREGMPVNLMESLAMGVPVITCDSRGCRDVVRNEIDGLLVGERSVSAFVEAMRRVINDQALLRRFSDNARQGRERFDRKLWIAEQISIYERLLKGTQPASFPAAAPLLSSDVTISAHR